MRRVGGMPDVASDPGDMDRAERSLRRISWITALWSLGYGLYRAYYALGATVGMTGTPVSKVQWIRINAVAAIMLFGTAVRAVAMMRLWKWSRVQPFLLAVCWCILRASPRQRWWMGSAVAATLVSTTIGLLSAFGVIGRVIAG